MIKKYFYPDIKYNNVLEIDIVKLKEKGIRYAILDIDNTLVPYTSPTPDEKALEFLKRLEENEIKFAFLSNNNHNRIDIFNKNIGAPALSNGAKPLLKGIRKIMREIDAKTHNTVMIGDQVFTDVCCGKRAGVYTVLVDPIIECTSLFFRFKRFFEKKIVLQYEKIQNKWGYIKWIILIHK